ncbi:SLATT domain-containing protein [Streptomyces sp. NBC_00365]|uniref:SLATT domain-containing protein n=1 Tax=Streptomyces sp. NBC_00365 TaxID=2975726 RepID=UPI0022501E2F|nr:SLATT domain-containing protein [Streptomyces sp. NBC_00365]MCX5097627.1 SLATT domain-containing protein [Streptomyces sp. NBC_00365]
MPTQQPPSLDSDTALPYVTEELQRQIRAFSSAKRFFRRVSLVQTLSAAALGAATSLLIGLAQIYRHDWVTALSLTTASLTTVAAAWAGWYGAREAWITNQTALNRLYALRSRIDFESAQGLVVGPERVAEYFAQFQQILDDTNGDWSRNRTAQTDG